MDENKLYWIWLTLKLGHSNKIKKLIEIYGSIENIYNCENYSDITDSKIVDLLKDKSLDKAKKVYNDTINAGAFILTYDSPDYPECLKHIYEPPFVLYAKGNMFDWDSFIGIGVVGTRDCDAYGIDATKYFAGELAKNDIMIISGLARGIDAVAAKAAIDAGKPTVGVLGCCIDEIYPRCNEDLFHMIEAEGVLLSEYGPGMPTGKWSFPQRNRIISGLSKGVLVTQAPKRSGALITARLAYENGRDVFAVPGNFNNELCVGTNRLIADGGICAGDVGDILREYPEYSIKKPEIIRYYKNENKPVIFEKTDNEVKKENNSVNSKEEKKPDFSGLNDIQKKICECIVSGNNHIDMMVREIGVSAGKLNNEFLMMEIEGIIKSYPGNKYGIN